jgi:hypothetical protein
VVVFFFANENKFGMITKHNSRFPWMTLILCLCLGSLIILPVQNAVDLSSLEICEDDFTEDDLMITLIGRLITDLVSLPFMQMTQDLHLPSLPPVFPPPKSF